tara:strand:- start:131227 stop:131457 length:231 start_codon:yes stop_codon:yes gene_type:complete
MTIELAEIVFYVLLIDSLGAVLVSMFGARWYTKNFQSFCRFFPPAKGWAIFYLILMTWIGSLLYEAGSLPLLESIL